MEWLAQYEVVWWSFFAGLLASIACGFGALPLIFPQLKLKERIGLGYGFAGGLMFSASVYNLLLPAFNMGAKASGLWSVTQVMVGIGLGCWFLWWVDHSFSEKDEKEMEASWFKSIGGRVEILIFLAMSFHSIPEGVAVGVGFASEAHLESAQGLGLYISLAIGIHNIPEGLAVALPLRARGASIGKCFFLAFLTSLPQPIASVPSSLLVWFFEPLMLPFLGFAAGAMMYLVLLELIPDALETRSRTETATAFMVGFCMMAYVQVGL